MEQFDVVIVGAGLWGLCAAHTFLKIDPYLTLLIVDSKKSVGGVWAAEQIYPGLRANNLQTNYEFSDFPILEADVGVKPRGVLTGESLCHYLEKYAQHFDLLRRLRLETEVLCATEEKSDGSNDSWVLKLRGTEHERTEVVQISCGKLVIATGQASIPNKIPFKGLDSFEKPVIHSGDLGRMARSWLGSEKMQHIVVVGGSKSAHDAVYMFATAGKRVTWLIRRPGHGRGVVPMARLYLRVGLWNVWRETLLLLRPLTWLAMAPWSDGDGFGWMRGFLERTQLGNSVVVNYHKTSSRMTGQQSGILTDSSTQVLRPSSFGLWYATQGNALNYDRDFYQVVRENRVAIVRDDIVQLTPDGAVHLESQIIRPDAIVCSTGYNVSSTIPLEPASRRLGWGCPVDPAEDTLYPPLDARADEELFQRFPLLRTSPNPPSDVSGLTCSTPWRLWRFLAPPSQIARIRAAGGDGTRNLVFLNAINCYQTTVKAELTSLWAYAYLHDRLSIPTPTEEEARYEGALWSRFGKYRAPFGMQGKLADMGLEAVPYYDLLLRDLGLRSWRKGWGWFGEAFGGRYGIRDYEGVVDEWIEAQSKVQYTALRTGRPRAIALPLQ